VEGPEDQRGGTVKGVSEKVFLFAEADNGFSTPSPRRHFRPRTIYLHPHLHRVRQLEGILLVAEMSTKPFAVYEKDSEGLVPVDHSAKCSWTVRQERREYAPSVGRMSDTFLSCATILGASPSPYPLTVRLGLASLYWAPLQGTAHTVKR
jgi:hypothetical protein